MAMLPFCGYNMADYFQHWLDLGASLASPPAIFRVNWFRTGEDGRFLWPGFGDNLRVLAWILDRCDGRGAAIDTPIGFVPPPEAIDRTGTDLSEAAMETLLKVDAAEWVEAVAGQEAFLDSFGDHLPPDLRAEHAALARRIHDAIMPAELHGRDNGA
jgi:phosphoenolpyruvate carboxykinase (GTP)